MNATFHLSLGVKSVDQSAAFFVRVLQATIAHRDAAGYVNIELFGAQITLQESAAAVPDDFHFGFNLAMDDFDRLAAAILASGYDGVISTPALVDAGTPMERKKMYVKCPSGYVIELKGYGRRSARRRRS